MRTLVSLIISCLITSCMSSQNDEAFIPKEYQFPDDSLLRGKTFIYNKKGTSDKNFIDLRLNVVGNKKYLISRQYSFDKLFDSAITLNDKTKEIYSFSFDDGRPLIGQIIQDTIIKNGTKLGLRIKRTIFKAKDYTSDNLSKLEYLKDTVIVWQKRKIKCIVMVATSTTQLISGTENSARQELTSYHNLYYGKHLGLLKYSINFKEEQYSFDLVEVQNTK